MSAEEHLGLLTASLKEHLPESAADIISEIQRTQSETTPTGHRKRIEDEWVSSLSDPGGPAYSIYADPYYLVEVWYCWKTYSRGYIRGLEKPGGALSRLRPLTRIVDLGCGLGFTTAFFTGLHPKVEVVGTNIAESTQWEIASRLAARFGFKLRDGRSTDQLPADLVFASEYFEHFREPVAHLQEVLRLYTPRCLVVANTFNNMAAGHFRTYLVNGEELNGPATGKAFSQVLKSAGYVPAAAKQWNNRPQVWWLGSEPEDNGKTSGPDPEPDPEPEPDSVSRSPEIQLRDAASLLPFTRNSRTHSDAQVAQLAASLDEFGMVGGIVVRDGTIAKGHGTLAAIRRLYAAGRLLYPPPGRRQGAKPYPRGMVPVIDATGWTETQFRAYVIADNQLALNAGWDDKVLQDELSALKLEGFDLNITGFSAEEVGDILMPEPPKYSRAIESPTYEIRGERPDVAELAETGKADQISKRIRETPGLTDEVRRFLLLAATRHVRFDFEQIAEFYAHATPEVQRLMEDQALVIIDIKSAIEKGYTQFSEEVARFIQQDHPEAQA